MFLESLELRRTCLGSLRPRPAHLGGSFWKPGREVHRGLWRAPPHPGHAPHLCLEGTSSLGRGPLCSQPCPRGERVQAPLQRWSPWPGPLLTWGPRSRGDSLPHLHSLGRNWGRGQPRPGSEVLAVALKSPSRISWSDSGSPPPCHPDSLAPEPPSPAVPVQVSPTSSSWSQLCCPHALAGQSLSEASLPLQPTSSSQMGPVPGP